MLKKRQFRGNLKEKSKAYLAGLIDSEGDISISRHISRSRTYIVNGKKHTYNDYVSYGISFAVYNTYLPLMKYLIKQFGGTYRVLRKETEKRQAMYAWNPNGSKHSLTLLKLIIPYISIKKKQAQVCLEFLSLGDTNCPEQRKCLYEKYIEEYSSSLTTDTSHILEWNTNIQNAYFSALFDGEGTASVYKSSTIWLTNSNRNILETAKNIYNSNEITGGKRNNSKPSRYPEYRIAIPVINMEKFILKILPYSNIKREQLLLTLEHLRGVSKERKLQIQKILFELKHPLKTKIQSELTGDSKSALIEILEA